MTVQLDWEPDGLVEKAGAAVGVDDRQVSGDLDRFKQFIENRAKETGAWRGDIPRESPRRRLCTTNTSRRVVRPRLDDSDWSSSRSR